MFHHQGPSIFPKGHLFDTVAWVASHLQSQTWRPVERAERTTLKGAQSPSNLIFLGQQRERERERVLLSSAFGVHFIERNLFRQEPKVRGILGTALPLATKFPERLDPGEGVGRWLRAGGAAQVAFFGFFPPGMDLPLGEFTPMMVMREL